MFQRLRMLTRFVAGMPIYCLTDLLAAGLLLILALCYCFFPAEYNSRGSLIYAR
jgi:hypothetical protein